MYTNIILELILFYSTSGITTNKFVHHGKYSMGTT